MFYHAINNEGESGRLYEPVNYVHSENNYTEILTVPAGVKQIIIIETQTTTFNVCTIDITGSIIIDKSSKLISKFGIAESFSGLTKMHIIKCNEKGGQITISAKSGQGMLKGILNAIMM